MVHNWTGLWGQYIYNFQTQLWLLRLLRCCQPQQFHNSETEKRATDRFSNLQSNVSVCCSPKSEKQRVKECAQGTDEQDMYSCVLYFTTHPSSHWVSWPLWLETTEHVPGFLGKGRSNTFESLLSECVLSLVLEPELLPHVHCPFTFNCNIFMLLDFLLLNSYICTSINYNQKLVIDLNALTYSVSSL